MFSLAVCTALFASSTVMAQNKTSEPTKKECTKSSCKKKCTSEQKTCDKKSGAKCCKSTSAETK